MKSIKNLLSAVWLPLCGAGVLLLCCSSCGWFVGEIKDEEVTELHKDMRAQTRTTIFTPALQKLGKMLYAYDIPDTPVQSKNLGNKTAEKNLPTELYAMTASAINKVGHPLIFVPYDAQYVVSESTTGGTIKRLYPKIVLSGGITGFDKDMFSKERETEAAGGWAGAQAGAHVKASGNFARITFDLNAMDYETQSYLPQVVASNSIALKRDSLGWGVYGYYMGNGASFDYDLKRKQGIHAALRNLVEFTLIEVLGKCFKVPYWRTIHGAHPDLEMIERLEDEFRVMNKEQQALLIKKLLFLHGYNGLNRHSPLFHSHEDAALKAAMRHYQAHNINDLYIKLWLNVPLKKAAHRVTIERRQQANQAREAERRRLAEIKKAEAERRAAAAARKKAYQEKVIRYNSLITRGDRLYKSGDKQGALTVYIQATQLFGGERYPRTMQEKIRTELRRQQVTQARYQALLLRADRLYRAAEEDNFNYKRYKEVLSSYRAALALAPGNNYIISQIKKITAKLSRYNTVFQDGGSW